MTTQVYKTFAKIFGVVLILVGIGALAGGRFDAAFVGSQLEAQKITMPSVEELVTQENGGPYTQEDVDALAPYAGEQMSNGMMAKAFADHYIAKLSPSLP